MIQEPTAIADMSRYEKEYRAIVVIQSQDVQIVTYRITGTIPFSRRASCMSVTAKKSFHANSTYFDTSCWTITIVNEKCRMYVDTQDFRAWSRMVSALLLSYRQPVRGLMSR
jgi:hypothetical protein